MQRNIKQLLTSILFETMLLVFIALLRNRNLSFNEHLFVLQDFTWESKLT